MTAHDAFTEPTTAYWQDLTPEIPARFSATPPIVSVIPSVCLAAASWFCRCAAA